MRLSGEGWSLDLTDHKEGIQLANYEGEVGRMPDAYRTVVTQFPGRSIFILVDSQNKPMLAMLAKAEFEIQSFLMVKRWTQ